MRILRRHSATGIIHGGDGRRRGPMCLLLSLVCVWIVEWPTPMVRGPTSSWSHEFDIITYISIIYVRCVNIIVPLVGHHRREKSSHARNELHRAALRARGSCLPADRRKARAEPCPHRWQRTHPSHREAGRPRTRATTRRMRICLSPASGQRMAGCAHRLHAARRIQRAASRSLASRATGLSQTSASGIAP